MSNHEPLALGPVITRADIPLLCEQLTTLVRDADGVVVCDVSAIIRPDLAAVEALAHLQVRARRSGCRLVLHRAGAELLDLLALAGLPFELHRQPE